MSGIKTVFILLSIASCFTGAFSDCPPCNYKLSATYEEYALEKLNAGGPADGTCSNDTVKYIHYGAYFGLPNDACCCLPIFQSTAPLTDDICPDNLGINKNETIVDYFQRFANTYPNAPSNGKCGEGKFKFVFDKDLIPLDHDICCCSLNNLSFKYD